MVKRSIYAWRHYQLPRHPGGTPLKLTLASISPRRARSKSAAIDTLTQEYIERAGRLEPTELALFPDEPTLLAASIRQPGRTAALLVLFDSRGDSITSEEFAAWLGRARDDGAQRIVFAIGPPDGWSATARAAATRTLSFGRMTMPHELARAVLAEQVYRALTILAGHPYHSGH